MKKFLAIFLALVLTMALLAGCAAKQATEAGQTAKTAETVKIVLLLPGEVNDQGWNASNYAGVVACNEKLGTKMEYVEAVQEADFESTFREYAERGYDIIMAAGSQFDEAASSVAANYPNTLFMVVNGAKCDKANLCPLFPKEYEASYLAAIVAGYITETGKFAMIGGDPNQAMQDLMAVYGKTAVSIAKEPVIRPVLDLSAVSAGADALNNLFYSQRAVGLVGQAAVAFEAQRSGSSQTTISVDNDDVVAELRTLRGEMASMLERMEKLRVVLNTGALVGELAEPMDVALGQRSTQRGRGI